jgi:hypothetical protein
VPDGRERTGVVIYVCLYCDKSVVLLEHEVRAEAVGGGKGTVSRTMVAPPDEPRTLHESAPAAARSLYEEGSRCEAARAFRGAAVLYRAAVEELVKDQGASGRDLYAKIESLRNEVSDELIDDLHEARILGNFSIHEGVVFSRTEVEDVALMIEEIVLTLYEQPEEKRAKREARKQRREAAPRNPTRQEPESKS